MANRYVRSGAGGSANGTSWTNAYTTLAAALTASSAGDTLYVADDHAETQSTNMTLTSPGTIGNLVKVICVNTHTTEPPTAKGTGATVTSTSTATMSFVGCAYYYGIQFNCGTGSTSGSGIATGSTATQSKTIFDNCKLSLLNSNAGNRIAIGLSQNTSAKDAEVIMTNTPVKFSATGQGFVLNFARFAWENTPSAVDTGGSIPTVLFTTAIDATGPFNITNVDLSALGSGKSLVAPVANATAQITFTNCRTGSSVSVLSTAITSPNMVVQLINCDSGSGNYRNEWYAYGGSVVTETTIKKTGGATDGTTGYSNKMVTLSAGPSLQAPYKGPVIAAWNETTGSSKALRVPIVHDSATNLTDADIWLEVVSYLGSSSYPVGSGANDASADLFATPADQTASSDTWTTTGLTNPNKQDLSVSFTPQMKGNIYFRVCMAKASYTVYYDPAGVIS